MLERILNKISKIEYLNLLVFLVAYIFIFYSQYNSLTAIVFSFLLLGIFLSLINRQIGFIFYIFTIFIFDDLPYDLKLSSTFTSIDTLTIGNQTATKIWTFVWILIFLFDFLKKKIYLPKDSIRNMILTFFSVSLIVGIINKNFLFPNPFINDFRFFINFIVGYLGVLLYLRKSNIVLDLSKLLGLIFIAKLIIIFIQALLLSRTNLVFTMTGDTGLYLMPTFVIIYFILRKNNSKIIIYLGIILSLLILGISASRGRILILFFQITLFFFVTGNLKRLPLILILMLIPLAVTPLISTEMYNYFMWKLTSFSPSLETGKSALVRLVEFQNIISQNIDNIHSFFLGKGLGGHWNSVRYPYPFNLYGSSSYPDDWITHDIYFKPHGLILFSLLKFGIGGTIIMYTIVFKTFFQLKKTFKSSKKINNTQNKLIIALSSGVCMLFLVAYSSKLQLFLGFLSASIIVLKKSNSYQK